MIFLENILKELRKRDIPSYVSGGPPRAELEFRFEGKKPFHDVPAWNPLISLIHIVGHHPSQDCIDQYGFAHYFSIYFECQEKI